MGRSHLSSSRVVVRSGLFNIAGFLASAVYMVMLVPMAKGFLGNEQYGLWTAVLAITGYIGLADLGLSTSFVTYLARFVAQGDLRSANRVITHGLLFYLLATPGFSVFCTSRKRIGPPPERHSIWQLPSLP